MLPPPWLQSGTVFSHRTLTPWSTLRLVTGHLQTLVFLSFPYFSFILTFSQVHFPNVTPSTATLHNSPVPYFSALPTTSPTLSPPPTISSLHLVLLHQLLINISSFFYLISHVLLLIKTLVLLLLQDLLDSCLNAPKLSPGMRRGIRCRWPQCATAGFVCHTLSSAPGRP